jgi:copper chaperone
MCSGSDHPQKADATAPASDLTFKVEDMTCGHCAQSIVKAINKVMPNAKVHADPVSKRVSVGGVTDMAAVQALVSKAGFTPTAI